MSSPVIKEAYPGHPVREPIVHKRGDTFAEKINLYQDEAGGGLGPDGDLGPYDGTGHDFHMQIRDPEDGNRLIVDIEPADFSLSSDHGTNDLLTIEKTHTAFTKKGEWEYDIEMTGAAGSVQTIRSGEFISNPDVTNPPS